MTATATHTCRDCSRTMLEPDMYTDPTGAWFCPICYAEGLSRLAQYLVDHPEA